MGDSTTQRGMDTQTIVIIGVAIIAVVILVARFGFPMMAPDPASRPPTEEESQMALSKSAEYGYASGRQLIYGSSTRAMELRAESDYWQCRVNKPKRECDNLR